jgi:Tol biopolymer transport system component
VTRDVDWNALPTDVPPRLLALLRDCLVRDPKQRLRDIGDARRVLDQIISGVPDPAAGIASAQSQTRPSGARAMLWGVAVVALAGVATLAFVHFRETPPIQQSARFQVRAPEKSSIAAFALSPDGRRLAFATGDSFTGVQAATSKLWLRPIDSLDARAVPGTEGIAAQQDQFFWSPDSEFIGFVTQDGKLKKVSVNGGPPQTLVSNVTPITRGAWGRNGIILLMVAPGAPIQRVPDSGGTVVDVTKKIDGWSRFQPQFLPDGRHFLYYVTLVSSEAKGIYVASLEDDAQGKRLLPDSTVASYVPSGAPGRNGYLLFERETTLMAQPFDADTVTLKGQMFPVAESVGRFSVCQNGTLAYMVSRQMFPRQELIWVDRSGRQLGVAAAKAQYRSVRLSPDEKSIAFDRNDEGNSDVWALDLVRGVPSRITSDPPPDRLPIWSPDGRRILWSRRSGNVDLYIKAASGTGQEEKLITMGTTVGWPTDWSRDDKFVLYQRQGDKTGFDLWMAAQSTGASGWWEWLSFGYSRWQPQAIPKHWGWEYISLPGLKPSRVLGLDALDVI